jgi:hypothetical protein
MGGLTPAAKQEHAFIAVYPGPGAPDRSHLCAICDKLRHEKPHNGIRIDREPVNTVTFPDAVTVNAAVSSPAFTITYFHAPIFQ